MKKFKILSILIICAFFTTGSFAKGKSDNWKNILPDMQKIFTKSIINKYVDVFSKSIPDLNDGCPILLNEFVLLSSITFENSVLDINCKYYGDLAFFLYEYDEAKGDFNPFRPLSKEESLLRMLVFLNSEYIEDFDLSDDVAYFLGAGKKVNINMIYANADEEVVLDDFDFDDVGEDEEVDPLTGLGLQITLSPNGKISNVKIMQFYQITEISIITPED